MTCLPSSASASSCSSSSTSHLASPPVCVCYFLYFLQHFPQRGWARTLKDPQRSQTFLNLSFFLCALISQSGNLWRKTEIFVFTFCFDDCKVLFAFIEATTFSPFPSLMTNLYVPPLCLICHLLSPCLCSSRLLRFSSCEPKLWPLPPRRPLVFSLRTRLEVAAAARTHPPVTQMTLW